MKWSVLDALYTSVLLNFVTAQASPRGKQKNVLVFGGNGFIGGETVVQLLGEHTEHKITLVSRGNWYWDSVYRIKPYVQHIKCDRMQTLRSCEPFIKFMESVHDLYFDAVLDFSGYHPFSMADTLYLLHGRVRLYVYISTDSVYDVCVRQSEGEEGLLETDSIRPLDKEEQQKLNQKEDYGHRKLECEDGLIKAHKDGGPDYVILRLPDVIGPRDTTHRWWIYQLWMKLHKYVITPLSFPKRLLNRPLSLVFVEDVASIIVSMVTSEKQDYMNEVYNLAFTERPTLKELLEMTASKLNITDLMIGPNEAEDAIYLYPSVSKGPVNTNKADSLLGWLPTRLDYAIGKTVQFYEDAIHIPYLWREKNQIMTMMQVSLTNNPSGNEVRGAVYQEYGVDLIIKRDEL